MARNPSAQTCDLVDARDEGKCVRCGVNLHGRMFSRHHRKLRRHGDHSPANLILLCGSGTTGCHGWVHGHPEPAYAEGWMLRSWQTPEAEPVLYWRRERRTLDREGGWTLAA